MIQPFVNRFMSKESEIREWLSATPRNHGSYDDLFRKVVEILAPDGADYEGEARIWYSPDPSRITVIDHGDYQGTRVFVVACDGYQPSTYWACSISYGSCSSCDSYQAVVGYSDEPPTPIEVQDLWTMMLHMVQELVQI